MEFKEILKDFLEENNLTQVAFAKKIGINQQTLSRYLLCQREIGLENLCKIADYFQEDLDFLAGRKDY